MRRRPADGIDTLLKGDAAADAEELEEVLGSLVDDLDAVADAAVAQSVFSLTQGNLPEATATLSGGGHRRDELPGPAARRHAPRGAHDHPPPAARPRPRRAAERLAGGRAAARTPRPPSSPGSAGCWETRGATASRCASTTPTAASRWPGPFAATLADVGLSALDLAFLAPAGEDTGLGRLGDVLAAWGEGLRPESVPATAVLTLVTGEGDPSTDDLALACRALRRLIAEARDLDGRDVASPGALEVPSGLDVGELEASDRSASAPGWPRRAKHSRRPCPPGPARPARGDVRAAMLALAGFELPGGVPKAVDPAALVAEGEALVAQIDARLAELDARVRAEKADWALRDEAGQVELLRGRAQLLIGHAMPVTPLFAAANGAELDTTFARPRLRAREDATGWLAAAGRADPGARRLRIAVDLVEAARNETLFDFALGQLPDHEEEEWAAVARPARDERGRLCLLATGPGPRFEGGPATGLVLGTWTEAIPRSGQTAGVAFHFDAPSARPPQAVLLCTAENEAGARRRGRRRHAQADARAGAAADGRSRDAGGSRPVPARGLPPRRYRLRAGALSLLGPQTEGRDDLATTRSGDGRPRPVRGPGGAHRRPAVAARQAVAGRRVQGRGRGEPDLRRDDAQPRPDHAGAAGRARTRAAR